MTTKPRFVYLAHEDMQKLKELSKSEYRDFRQQAAWIIAQYVRGNLVIKADESFPEPPETELIP